MFCLEVDEGLLSLAQLSTNLALMLQGDQVIHQVGDYNLSTLIGRYKCVMPILPYYQWHRLNWADFLLMNQTQQKVVSDPYSYPVHWPRY